MNVILDECLPRRLIRDLAGGHQVTTVPRHGWSGLSDLELLRLIPEEFDVWITMDSNLRHQHTLESIPLGVIVLHAKNNRYETLKELVPGMLVALTEIGKGRLIDVKAEP